MDKHKMCVFMLSPHLLEAAKPVKCPLPLLTHSGVSLSFIIFISLFTETANEMNVLWQDEEQLLLSLLWYRYLKFVSQQVLNQKSSIIATEYLPCL